MRVPKVHGFTLVELLIVVAIIGVIAAIAIPGLMRARMSGNEASAIGSLRAVNTAQSTYSASCSPGNYAGTLADLGKPPQSGSDAFIGADLSTDPSTKSGYIVALTGGAAVSGGTGCNTPSSLVQTYFVGADPSVPSSTGSRYFGTNQAGTIYQSASTVAPMQVGAPPGATAIQ